jgi:hemerythrin-like domain-containing protein
MANSLRIWQDEHVNFAKLLDLIAAQLDLFHDGETPDYDLMLDVMFYMTHYPDVVHHPKEELAFARIRKRDKSAAPLLAKLDGQHAELHRLGQELVASLSDVVNGAIASRDSIEGPARSYVATFREHMQLEDAELVPLVRQWLDARDWAAIEAAIRHVDDPLFGRNPERRYALIAEHLRQAAA